MAFKKVTKYQQRSQGSTLWCIRCKRIRKFLRCLEQISRTNSCYQLRYSWRHDRKRIVANGGYGATAHSYLSIVGPTIYVPLHARILQMAYCQLV